MLQGLVAPLLEELGKRTTSSPPTILERIIGHLCYLLGLSLVVLVALRWFKVIGDTVGTGTLVSVALGLALFSFLFLFWAVRYRKVGPELWYVSHLLWIAQTFTTLALMVSAGLLLLAFGLLFAALATVFAAVTIYGSLAAAMLIMLWVSYRCGRGYGAFLRGNAVGPLVTDS